jgi:hypothetical protein
MVGAALLGATEFEAVALDGRTAVGTLAELNERQVVIETAAGRQPFELAELATLSRKGGEAPVTPKAALAIELVDTSGLAAAEYTVDAGTARVVLAGGAKLEIPTKAIRSVRFRPPGARDEALDKQWSEITRSRAAGDLLVVREEDQLDYHEGVLGNIDAETCHLEMDKEDIPAKRAKAEGLIYFHPAATELPDPVGRLRAGGGSEWSLAAATLADGAVQIATPGGVTLTLPLDTIGRLDFTAGKIAYLSDLEPERATYVPFFGFQQDLGQLKDFYGYRRDAGFENSPLVLDGVSYKKGLALQSQTLLVYRLPGKFRVLKGVVGIDDGVRASGNARLRIAADGKTVWEGDVRGSDPPRELEVAIDGARRLEIVADYGEDQDIGDRVNLCDARVTK